MANEKVKVEHGDKKQVFVRVVFIKVGDINTLQENFSADVFVQARWREHRLDKESVKGEETELEDWDKYWNPSIYVENCLSEPKESVWYQLHYDLSGAAYIVQKRRIKCLFFEKMELNSYPFDSQELSVCITSHKGEDEIDLIADPSEISTVNTQSFVDEQEWRLHKHISSFVKMTTDAYRSSRHKHPAVYISCHASRRFSFFLWNIIFIMANIPIITYNHNNNNNNNNNHAQSVKRLPNFFVTETIFSPLQTNTPKRATSGVWKLEYFRRLGYWIQISTLLQIFIGILLFTTFVVDVTLIQNRLQISFILLLSNITFKFNIAQTLPKVSYLTLLDKYVIMQMSMMFVVCLWHTTAFLLYSLNGEDVTFAKRYDGIAFIILLVVYVIFQLVFTLYAVYLVKKKGKFFTAKEKKQKEMLFLMEQNAKKGNKRQILPEAEV